MYKSRRGVDKSQLGNRWKKGLVFFSCLCWELSSNPHGMAGGRSPSSLGGGVWKPGLCKRRWTGSCSHTWYLNSRSFYCEKLCLYLQLSAHTVASWSGDEMAQSQTHFPFPGSQQVAHVGSVQWAGPSFSLLPTYSPRCVPVWGLVLKVAVFTSIRAPFPQCLLKKHVYLSLLSPSLWACFLLTDSDLLLSVRSMT